MIRALVAKSVRDARLLLAALVLLMFIVPFVNTWVSSKIRLSAVSDFLLNALPRQWERVSGVPFTEVATPAGRVALVYVHPFILLAAAGWAIARGSDIVSGEIGRGTMEMLLAQPVPRWAVYVTQAATTIVGAALLALAAWCGTAVGLTVIELPQPVSASVFVPAAVNLFCLTVCLGGMTALASSCDSQRWRTIGLMVAIYVVSGILKVIGRMSDSFYWLQYTSLLTAYEPQAMVAHPEEAWTLWSYQDGAAVGLGLGGYHLALLAIGVACYVAGALIFNRRELPAPI